MRTTGNDARQVLSTIAWHTVGPHQVPSWPLFTACKEYQAPTTAQMALEGKTVTSKPLSSRWEGGGQAEKAWPALLGFCGRDSAETCSHHKFRAKAPQSNLLPSPCPVLQAKFLPLPVRPLSLQTSLTCGMADSELPYGLAAFLTLLHTCKWPGQPSPSS